MKNRQTEIKWAILFMLMTFAWMYLERMLGYHDEKIEDHPWFTMLYFFPAVAVMVLALREKKHKDYHGHMTYKQGFISGAILSLIIAVLSVPGQYLISTVITPHYFDNVRAAVVAQGTMTMEQAEAYFNLNNYMMQSGMAALVMGLATTAIAMIFMRSKTAPAL